MQYHEVRIEIQLHDISSLVVWSGLQAPQMSNLTFDEAGIMVDYIYLDSEERRRFAQVGHEYLIEQVQDNGTDTLTSSGGAVISQKFKLDFNHPCKEIVWALKCGAFNGEGQKSSLSGGRGRFLAYTNNTAESAWSTALDYAARNLANGMVNLSSTAQVSGTPAGSTWTQVNVNVSVPASTSYTWQQLIGGVVWNFVINNQGAHAVTGVQSVWINSTPLVKNSYNLAADLVEVTVALTPTTVSSGGLMQQLEVDGVSGAIVIGAGNTALNFDALTVNEHNLSLADVSVPVGDWTDSRLWVLNNQSVNQWDVTVVQPSNYGLALDGSGNPVSSGNITLNGHDRFQVQAGDYFNYVQPYQHHTRTPTDGINVYSFALHPEQHQPSGSCNMSRIDSAYLVLRFADGKRVNRSVKLDFTTDSNFYVYTLSYNIFRCMSGIKSKRTPVPKSQMLLWLISTIIEKHFKLDHALAQLLSIALYNWLVDMSYNL